MVKHGLLDGEAPARLLGIQNEEIPGLIDWKEIVEEASDVMDEEGAVERVVERLGSTDGNQSVTVAAILEVSPYVRFSFSLCKCGYRHIISMQCRYFVRVS